MAKKPKKEAEPVAAPDAHENVAAAVDPATLEPKPVAPPPETSKTVDVVYMPGPEGPDETAVAGVAFRAYEPVAVHAHRHDITKLHNNPWFGAKVDTERHAAWKDYREKQAAARRAREELDSLL